MQWEISSCNYKRNFYEMISPKPVQVPDVDFGENWAVPEINSAAEANRD
jgi:hypothetical protein